MGLFQGFQAQWLTDARGVAGNLLAEAQVADLDHLLRTDDAGAFHHVAQFPHVARPAVGLQRGNRGIAEAAGRAPVVLDERSKEAFGQGQHVFRTLTHGGQVEGDDVEAVEQVLAELALAHHLLEVEIGRGEDAHIGAAGHRVADALVLLVLDEAQQLGLQRQREVADLVEEQRAAIGLIDPAQGAFGGSGERAAVVAEQLAFHQVRRQRGAVDGDEGLLRAPAPGVDGTRQLALAGAGLAEDEDIGVGVGDLACGFQHRHHRRAVRAERIAALLHLAFQGLQARRHLPDFQLLGCGQAQLLRAARLEQVVRGAGLHGVDRGVDGRMGGDDHDPHPGREHAHLLQHIEAVVLAQAQVQKTEIEYLALQDGFCLCGAGGGHYGIAAILQTVTEGTQDRRFVIHQKDAPAVVRRLVHGCSQSDGESVA